MGLILQGIKWSLERPCPLRCGERWVLPDVTRRQLDDISAYSDAIHDGRVFDDGCVTAWTSVSDSDGSMVKLPCSGFRVSLALAPFGGEGAVKAACGGCEANVAAGQAPVLAGCHGFLWICPDSERLEAELREKVRVQGLELELARLFPRTMPLWYGFWIESPLHRPHCQVLLALLERTDSPGEQRDDDDDDLQHFLAALRAAVNWKLPLHVEMTAYGHADLAWHMVFPPCPRCKASASAARRQQSDPDKPFGCAVCGHRFSKPAETYKMKRTTESDWEASRLENVLGAGEVEGFRRRFLAHQGCSPAQIDDILDRERKGPRKLRINELRRRQQAVRRSLPARGPITDSLSPELTLGLENNVSLRLRLLPAGEFLMGAAGPPDDIGDHTPQHWVRIKRPFYLGNFPITQAQFEAVMSLTPARFIGESGRPVEQVDRFAAQEFCLRLSQATGYWVRLPSEAEWEYGCRAGTTSKYHWGEAVTTEQVNCKTDDPTESGEKDIVTNVPGRYAANAWGIYDMHGNVQEWCEDEWHENYEGAPEDGSAWVTSGDENPFRPLRGGSCCHHAAACTSASRHMLRADAQDELYEDPGRALVRDWPPVGFRVVVEAG